MDSRESRLTMRFTMPKIQITRADPKEIEIEVNDFDATNEILGELGYKPRGIQENKRIKLII